MSVLMQDSGVQWIGDIPENWKIVRIKDVSQTVKTGKTPPSKVKDFFHNGKVNWFTPGDMTKLVLENGSNRKLIEEAISEDYVPLFNEGAVLLVGIGATVGKVSLINCKASCNQQINAIEFDRLYPKYGLYYMTILSDEIQKFASYVTLPIFTQTETKQLKLPFPKKTEQKKIADFLDKATLQIDDVIKTKEKQLKTLEALKKSIIHKAVTKGLDDSVEMIDSKIEWIGDIPKSWKCSRIKNISTIFGRIGFRGYTVNDLVDENEGAISLSPSNIVDGFIDCKKSTYLSWEKYDESPEIKIYNNDIIFVKTGSSFGKVAFIENLEKKATLNPQLVVFKDIKLNNKFLYYTIISSLVNDQINTIIAGSTIPTLSQTKLGNCYIFIPSKNEQKQIVEFLDTEVEKINTLKVNVKNQIEKLKEYKKSLIYEYVTGKKQIKG